MTAHPACISILYQPSACHEQEEGEQSTAMINNGAVVIQWTLALGKYTRMPGIRKSLLDFIFAKNLTSRWNNPWRQQLKTARFWT